MAKLTGNADGCIPSNSTLKLLTDYTFQYSGGDTWGLLSFSGSNITLDLNERTLTVTVGGSYLFDVSISGNFTITNGTIRNGMSDSLSKSLFDSGYCQQSEFHSVGVEYGPDVLNPWTGLQMTPEVA